MTDSYMYSKFFAIAYYNMNIFRCTWSKFYHRTDIVGTKVAWNFCSRV